MRWCNRVTKGVTNFLYRDVRNNRCYCMKYQDVRKRSCISSPPQKVLNEMVIDRIALLLGHAGDPDRMNEADKATYGRWEKLYGYLKYAPDANA